MLNRESIKEKLQAVPSKPGVYTFKGPREKILYVGKAKNLSVRLRSYFQKTASLDYRKSSMLGGIRDFSYIVTGTELEALVLEANLIKQYKPRFNVILRDDKNYPYLKLTVNEQWPRLEVVRKIKKDGSIYFGPYVQTGAMWEALSFIRRNFNIRPCRYGLQRPMRPCIQYQMGRCPGPCAGYISREAYMKAIEEVRLFLEGERKGLLDELKAKMRRLSDEMKFEEAARIRDRVESLKKLWQSQKVISPALGDIDVLGVHRGGRDAAFQVFFIRKGIMIGARDFIIRNVSHLSAKELLYGFIEMFYAKEILPPPEIILEEMPRSPLMLTSWLGEKRAGKVRLTAPKKGKKRQLLSMAMENAEEVFRRKTNSEAGLEDAVQSLRERFFLKKKPSSIGAFDVSTLGGRDSAGAFVYWKEGSFVKDFYRHLKIKTVEGIDDYSMMAEIVKRTLENMKDSLPDLIVIDGGRGHLEAARKAVEGLFRETPEMIALAKKPDRVFALHSEAPVNIEDKNPSSLLLRSIRDEAHRFAVSFHRKLRDKRLMESPLEKIKGIGEKRRLALLRHFGSLDAIRRASVEELIEVKGIDRKRAALIKEVLGEDLS